MSLILPVLPVPPSCAVGEGDVRRAPPGARAQGARAPHSTGRARWRGTGESGAHSRRPAGVSGLSGVSGGSVGSAGALRAAGAARRGGTWSAAQSGAGSGARTGRAMRGRIERRRGRHSEPASIGLYCRESGAGLCFSTVAVIRRLRAAAGGGSREWRWRERVRDGWRSVGRFTCL